MKKASLNIFTERHERSVPGKVPALKKDITPYGFLRYLWVKRKIVFTNYSRRLNMEWINILPQIISLPMIGLAFLGLFSKPWDRHRWQREIYLFAMLYPLLVYPYSTMIARYLIPTSVIILLWVGNGIVELLDWSKNTGSKYASLAIFMVGMMMCFLLAVKLTQPIRENPYYRYWREHREMGLWMSKNLPPGQSIMSRKPYISFYAKGDHIQLPDKEIEEILEMAKSCNIDYLVIDERGIRSYKSATLKVSLKNGEAFGLREVHRLNPEQGYSIALYDIPEK